MKKVLIIEDLQVFAITLATLIAEKFGFECDSAGTIAKAKQMLEDNKGQYFVAIVDLHLPDGDKGESVDLVKEYDVPSLVFTSEINKALREDLLHKGVADYTLKDGDHNLGYVINMVDRIYRNYSINVLVVDDSASAREIMTYILGLQRYQVITAASGEEAECILEQRNDIRVAIVDCEMDGMSGIELTERLRKKYDTQNLAIIGVSGKGDSSQVTRFIKNGANDFLVKPFDQEEFLTRINSVVHLLEVTENLERLNKQKNDLIAVAAHDIRGPLGIIINAAKMISSNKRPEKNADMLSMIEKSARNTVTLVEDMLCVSAIESGGLGLQEVRGSLHYVVKEAVAEHQLSADEKNQSFKVVIDELQDIDFDKVRIRQVIDNLMSNAIKYSPMESEIVIELHESDHYQVLKVSDQGPGIPDEKVAHLYEPYYTFGNVATGGESSTGLGLSICKNIMTAHGGKLSYTKSESGGSCFQFDIPYASLHDAPDQAGAH